MILLLYFKGVVFVVVHVNGTKNFDNVLIFKFENFSLSYPNEILEFLNFSNNKGTFKEIESINTLGKCSYRNIIVVGLGTTEEFNNIKLSKALGFAIKSFKNNLDQIDILDNLNEDYGFDIGETIKLSLYKFHGIKQAQEKTTLSEINILTNFAASVNKGLTIGENVNMAREMINLPSNYITPKYMAQQAQIIANNCQLDIEIIDKYMLEQLGMESILYVSKGSTNNPRLIVIQYFGDTNSKEITALIGKGVTFDSGGISLKNKSSMENMVTDMAGAASVLSIIKTIGEFKPKKNIIALIPTVENMPSGSAYKPGDVITTYSGKTVQVISTDAEGRLILCDAITYAKELGATTIIDIATLTGSCANFLGSLYAGILSNCETLSNEIIGCGQEVGEGFWKLPNDPEYMELLKTPSADIKNSSTVCGAIAAGMFLQSFADDTNFAHIDIAGCASYKKATDIYEPGANGMPARTLIHYLLK